MTQQLSLECSDTVWIFSYQNMVNSVESVEAENTCL